MGGAYGTYGAEEEYIRGSGGKNYRNETTLKT